MTVLDAMTAADFAALRGDRFRVDPDGAPEFDTELVEVTEISRAPGPPVPFSLVFEGGPKRTLPQRLYRVQHEQLGKLEIFLVPVAPARYEAVFT